MRPRSARTKPGDWWIFSTTRPRSGRAPAPATSCYACTGRGWRWRMRRGSRRRDNLRDIMKATIQIPMLPPRECSPNWRGHWSQRAKAVRAFRETAGWATYQALDDAGVFRLYGCQPVTLDAEIAWCCGRKSVDPTNAPALLKAAIDGIADVLWFGRDRHVQLGDVRQTRGDGTVTVTLRGEEAP